MQQIEEIDRWVLRSLIEEISAKSAVIVGEMDANAAFDISAKLERLDTVYAAQPQFGPVDLVVFCPSTAEDLVPRVKHFWGLLNPGGIMAFVGARATPKMAAAIKPLFGKQGELGEHSVILGTRTGSDFRRDGGLKYENSSTYFVAKDAAPVLVEA